MTDREIIATAFWEGGRFTPREPFCSLSFDEREGLMHRADAVIAALAQVDRCPEGQDREDGLDRNDESAVPGGNAPKRTGND